MNCIDRLRCVLFLLAFVLITTGLQAQRVFTPGGMCQQCQQGIDVDCGDYPQTGGRCKPQSFGPPAYCYVGYGQCLNGTNYTVCNQMNGEEPLPGMKTGPQDCSDYEGKLLKQIRPKDLYVVEISIPNCMGSYTILAPTRAVKKEAQA